VLLIRMLSSSSGGASDAREARAVYLGVKIPPTNLQDYHLDAARKFADGLADRLLAGTMGA
jgi:hypothetical protein